MKTVERYVLGMIKVNTYVVWNAQHVLIIDPGSNPEDVIQNLKERNAVVDGVILTHGHFDHIAGIDKVIQAFSCPFYINPLDSALLQNPLLNGSMEEDVIVKSKPNFLKPGKQIIGTFSIEVIDTPGHTEGSSLILWDQYMFSGDVVFRGSIGRTDFVGGSNTKMKQSLTLLKTLDPSYIIYPGHGLSTTLQQELLENPYLR